MYDEAIFFADKGRELYQILKKKQEFERDYAVHIHTVKINQQTRYRLFSDPDFSSTVRQDLSKNSSHACGLEIVFDDLVPVDAFKLVAD